MRAAFQHNSPVCPWIVRVGVIALLAVFAPALGGAQFAAPPAPAALPAPTLRAQDISVKDPAEFNAYSQASTQADPKAKAAGLEAFLTSYPQSVIKKAVLDMLIDTYQQLGDADHALSAATRLLQLDPANMKALFLSVAIKKSQCQKTSDAQTCDDAAALARKGLAAHEPPGASPDDWKKMTAAAYPIFHSAIAVDDIVSKKDIKAGISEYRTGLMLYPPDQTRSGQGLADTLQLAEAYAKLTPPDAANAVWFYARALAFAPANFKPQIEKKLDYWYKKNRGRPGGIDKIKVLVEITVFPPETFLISQDAMPAEAADETQAADETEAVEEPVHWQELPVAAQTLLPALEAAVFPAKPPAPGVPDWPAFDKPAEASVVWDSQGLRIDAANSSLEQILKDVSTATGAKIEGFGADQRVFGQYGPGQARDVLSQLLQGSGYNVIMIGDQGQGAPRQVLLSSRQAGGAQPLARPANSANNEEDEVEEPPANPEPSPVRPGFPPGSAPRTPQQIMQEMQQRQQQGQPAPGQPQPLPNPQN